MAKFIVQGKIEVEVEAESSDKARTAASEILVKVEALEGVHVDDLKLVDKGSGYVIK